MVYVWSGKREVGSGKREAGELRLSLPHHTSPLCVASAHNSKSHSYIDPSCSSRCQSPICSEQTELPRVCDVSHSRRSGLKGPSVDNRDKRTACALAGL